MSLLILTLINTVIITLTVFIHYESLNFLARFLDRDGAGRITIAIGVLILLTVHAAEIWFFGLAYYWKDFYITGSELVGNTTGTLLDCVYFSFTTYTTLGFGDIHPTGDIRYLVGLEALTGLLLVSWTASFLFMEMVNHWQAKNLDKEEHR